MAARHKNPEDRCMRTLSLPCLAVVVSIAGCSGTADTSTDPGTTSAAALAGNPIKNYRQVLQLAHTAGLPCDGTAVVAAAIAMAESSFNVLAENYNTDGSTDYGLWQINSVHGYPAAYLLNSTNNAAAMYAVSDSGQDFTPWVTYNTGAYDAYTEDAWTAWGEHECD
jgi:Lysozyme like domain